MKVLPTGTNMSCNKEMKKQKQSKLKQLLKSPGKILSKARDLYVKSMVIWDGQMGSYGGGGAMACPVILPRSFSAGSVGSSSHGRWVRDGDYEELVRAASGRRVEELEGSKGKPVTKPAGGTMKMMMKHRRSCSVGVGRIDEDEVCEFGEEVMVVRTRSHADPRRRIGGGSVP